MEKYIGIYIHIPFCQKKCKYCDFASYDRYNKCEQEKYIEALIKEIQNCKENYVVNTIYIGGGTPSIISGDLIEKIIKVIKEKFILYENCEITLEINPGTVDKGKIEKYHKSGINRISIGLQSTENEILRLLGRIHTYEEFLEVYNLARNVGFENINIDLMLGIPNQNLEILEKSVKEVVELNPEHISLYSLILEEGTELEKLVSSNQLKLPSDDVERRMYWNTKRILENSGYSHYEISNFAKKGFESKHNLNCWNQDEYIGFGVAAHSYLNKTRYSNIENVEKYIENTKNNNFEKNIILQEKKQNFEEEAKEYMMLGFRKNDGISITNFEQKFQISPLLYFRQEFNKLEKLKLIEIDLDKIRLTNKGLNLANTVFEEFV